MEYREITSLSRPVVLIAGAGISVLPPAAAPLWTEMASDTIQRLLDILQQGPFEIEPDTLKQIRSVCNTITAPFEDFDLVVEAFLKPARLSVEKVIGDLVEPVIERSSFLTQPISDDSTS